MAEDSFNRDLASLLAGGPTPAGAPPRSLDDLLGAPPASVAAPGPAREGSIDISALLVPPAGGPLPGSAPSPLAALLNPLVAAADTPLPVPEIAPAPAPPLPPVLPEAPPDTEDPLMLLLAGPLPAPEAPRAAEPAAVLPPAAPQEPPSAAPALPVEFDLDLGLDLDEPPALDAAVARRVPSPVRQKLPHAQCPACGKPGVPSLATEDALGRAAVVAGLAHAGRPGEGWRCLGCGEAFLSRESVIVVADDAAGHARLARVAVQLADALAKAGYAGF